MYAILHIDQQNSIQVFTFEHNHTTTRNYGYWYTHTIHNIIYEYDTCLCGHFSGIHKTAGTFVITS